VVAVTFTRRIYTRLAGSAGTLDPMRLRLSALLALAVATAAPAATASADAPIVIGHRGAAGYLPDHTLAGYALAIKRGADYIEPDLVATKDGVLVARHEPNIAATTDVADHPEFASRKRTAVIDGATETGWFVSDFTLREIRTLRARQPLPERPQQFNGRYRIPTFTEVINVAKKHHVGIYPETKHPTYHQRLGLALEGRLVSALKKAGLNRRDAPVFIQSFEQANLKQLNTMTPVHLVQLLDANDVNPDGTLDFTAPYDRPYDWTVAGRAGTFASLTTDAGLDEVRTYADGIGPWKPYINSWVDNHLIAPTDLVARAHARGLVVHPYTFRSEQHRLLADYAGNPINEYLHFYELGVDGVFSDFPDTAVTARELFLGPQEEGLEEE